MYNSEEVIGLIERVNPWGPKKEWNLFFTNRRVIVARVGGGLGRSLVGVIGHALDGREAEKTSDKLKILSVNEILKAHEDNFTIEYPDVLEVTVKKPGWLRTISKLKIKTRQENYEFDLAPVVDKDKNLWWKKCVQGLQLAFGEKLTIK